MSKTRETFYQAIQQAYGVSVLKDSKNEISQISDFLFRSDILPTLQHFEFFTQTVYNKEEFIKQQSRNTYSQLPYTQIWKSKK